MTSLQLNRVVSFCLIIDNQFFQILFLSGDNSDTAPPDSISNSEVKRISGDGSVGFPHARVAHRQASIHLFGEQTARIIRYGFFVCAIYHRCFRHLSGYGAPDGA